MVHADEYWQSFEPAYAAVYSDVTKVYLPWEWSPQFKLRNAIYPMYMYLPMLFVRTIGLDTNFVVRTVPYLAHLPIVLTTDYFVWAGAKRIVTKDVARMSIILYLSCTFQTMHLIRTLTNTIEQMFTVVAFYYFLDQGRAFTKSTAVMTGLITTSFMIRNTSPVGWIPLLAIKVF